MRKPFVAGNWKMYGTQHELRALVHALKIALPEALSVDVVICPSFVYLPLIKQQLINSKIQLGAQNHYHREIGAYTGEVAASMLQDIGCQYVILGHSERRHGLGETNQQIAEKFILAQQHQLIPILCVGETLAEREADTTTDILQKQLIAVIEKAGIGALQNAVLAYEPVWAIGTGIAASVDQIQQVHAALRNTVAEFDRDIADGLRIVYGGSLKPANAEQIFALSDVDGGLVGGPKFKV